MRRPIRFPLCDEVDCPTPDETCEACVRVDEQERIARAIAHIIEVARDEWLAWFDLGGEVVGPAAVVAAYDQAARIALSARS